MQNFEYKHIKFTLAAQFHVLLHFSGIDQQYREMLLKNGFTHEQIEQQLQEDRSKFDIRFASNPEILWEKIAKQIKLHNYQTNSNANKLVLIISYADQSVGEDNLYQLPEPFEHSELNQNTTDNHIIKIYGTPVETNQINCILRQADEQFEVITIFPGVYAPPFPDFKNQNQKEYAESKAFWSTHAIINKK
jgi:hypothetical protein